MKKVKSTTERFWEKVHHLENGCWEWTGCKSNGYGQFGINGKLIYAHRFAFELTQGQVPLGMELDHLCRNHSCVNPNHLEIVTHRENILRGINVIATNSQVTHCPQGHPYDLLNTYFLPNGGRDCRICRREAKRRWRARK